MTVFIQLRDKIRHFIAAREFWVMRIWHMAVAFVSFLVLHQVIGYQRNLNHWWVALILAVLCGFMPVPGATVVLIFYGLLHLMALSANVAFTSLILILASVGICAYFQARNMYHIVATPVCQQLRIPYLIPMEAGLTGSLNDVASVICGSVLAYYFKVIKENASMFLDATASVSAMDLIQRQMLGNNMFYVYMSSMLAMFLVVYFIRCRNIRYAWNMAVVFGVLTEFVIMLAGYLFNGSLQKVPELIIGNGVVLLIGLTINFFFLNLDYSRTEKVQFEDDEYYYYVTAVPKVQIAVEEKKVEQITGTQATKQLRKKAFGRRGKKGVK